MEAFIKLIERYETITLEEIGKAFINSPIPWRGLTGFGHRYTCSLCIIYLSSDCVKCPWVKLTGDKCGNGINTETYRKIPSAVNSVQLLEAYRGRAKYMRSVLAPYLKK